MPTTPEEGKEIVGAWLEWDFKQPCPASKAKPGPEDIQQFLDSSLPEMAALPQATEVFPLCNIKSSRVFSDVTEMLGGRWSIIRELPTAAVVKIVAGSIKPAHHHTFSNDIFVTSSDKKV